MYIYICYICIYIHIYVFIYNVYMFYFTLENYRVLGPIFCKNKTTSKN